MPTQKYILNHGFQTILEESEMFVCNYSRKTFTVDHGQKYVEIAKDCLWIKIADERLRFLQTKHLQCVLDGFLFTGKRSTVKTG